MNGTTTLKTTWSDTALSIPNTNPLILNSNGNFAVQVFADDSDVFSIEVKDANDVVTRPTIDDVFFLGEFSLASADVLAALASNSDPVEINGSQMTGSAYSAFADALAFTAAGSLVNTAGITTLGSTNITNGDLTVTRSSSGAEVAATVKNTSDTSGSTAKLSIVSGGGSAGDPLIDFQISGLYTWRMGVDNSDSDSFAISANADLGAGNALVIDTSKNVFVPAGTLAIEDFSTSGASNGVDIGGGRINISKNLTSSLEVMAFHNPNGEVGTIKTSGTATSYNVSSDPRLKSKFTPFEASEAWGKFDLILANSGKFNFLADPSLEVWGLNAHGIIDAGLDIGSEGNGPRNLNLGDVYQEAVMGERPVMRLVADDDGKESFVDSGETEEYEITPALTVSPAGVDQSKLSIYLLAVIDDLRNRLNALEGK